MSINHEPTHHTNPNLQEGESRSLDSSIVSTPTPDELRDQVHPNRRRSIAEILDTRAKKWGAAVAIAVTALGGPAAAYEISANATHSSPSTEKTAQPTHDLNGALPTADATANATGHDLSTSSPSPSSIETGVANGNYELKVGQSPEQVGTNLTGLVSTWGMEGATPGLGSTDEVLRTPLKTFAQNAAVKSTEEIAPKILGPNYKEKMAANPRIAKFVSQVQAANADNIEAFVRTDNTGLSSRDANPNNVEAWKSTNTFESVKSSTHNPDGSTTDIFAVQESNNAYMNVYKSVVADTKIDELLSVTYKPLGDTLDVTDIAITKAP